MSWKIAGSKDLRASLDDQKTNTKNHGHEFGTNKSRYLNYVSCIFLSRQEYGYSTNLLVSMPDALQLSCVTHYFLELNLCFNFYRRNAGNLVAAMRFVILSV